MKINLKFYTQQLKKRINWLVDTQENKSNISAYYPEAFDEGPQFMLYMYKDRTTMP